MDVSAAVMPKIIDPKLSHCQTSTTENNSFKLNIEFEYQFHLIPRKLNWF